MLLLLMICVSSACAMFFAAQPALETAAARRPWLRRRVILCSGAASARLGDVFLGAAAGFTVLLWLFTGSMALNNVLGVSLCTSFVAVVRVPNVKVCTALLGALFLYDCFWVFFSERLFGRNVMVEAATQQADNPAMWAAAALHLPLDGIAPHLDLPVKLVFPRSILHWGDPNDVALMLGLGDMALPGMLIALMLCDDVARWVQRSGGGGGSARRALASRSFWAGSYVLPAWVGYALGMVAALGIGTVFQAPQPALFYLVPATLAPVAVAARRRGELRAVWEGWDTEPGGKSIV